MCHMKWSFDMIRYLIKKETFMQWNMSHVMKCYVAREETLMPCDMSHERKLWHNVICLTKRSSVSDMSHEWKDLASAICCTKGNFTSMWYVVNRESLQSCEMSQLEKAYSDAICQNGATFCMMWKESFEQILKKYLRTKLPFASHILNKFWKIF